MGILDAIAQPQLADISGALDIRQKRLDADEAKRKEIRMGQLIAEATPNLKKGSPLHEMALNDPKNYMVFSKALGIPLNAGDQMQEMADDVNSLYVQAQADPRLAYEHAIQLKQERNAQGRETPQLDKWIAGVEEDPPKAMTSLFVMHRSLNPAKPKDDFTLGDTRYSGDGDVIATNPRGTGADKTFRGEIVDTPDGAYVYSGTGTTVEPLRDPSGKQVTASRYDAGSVGNIARAKTNAEVTTKQSLDLAKDYFEKIAPINNYIANYDDANRLIDEGAETGKIASLLPSFRQASIELDNVQRSLGLNVVGNTTFGALSKGELDLALDVGLPTRLEGKELKDWISRKKSAQVKMRNYLEKAVSYLGEGNTIADLSKVQKQDREQATEEKKPTAPAQETAAQRLARLTGGK